MKLVCGQDHSVHLVYKEKPSEYLEYKERKVSQYNRVSENDP